MPSIAHSRPTWVSLVMPCVAACAGLAVLMLMRMEDGTIGLGLLFLAAVAVWGVIQLPEVMFALFLQAGYYKGDPRLQGLAGILDLTITFAAILIFGVVWGVVRGRIRLEMPRGRLLIPYGVIALLAVVSLSYTSSPIYGLDKTGRFLTLTTLALFAPLLVLRTSAARWRFAAALVGISVAMFIDAISNGVASGEIGVRTAFGSNYVIFGRAMGAGVILVTMLLAAKARGWRLLGWWAVATALLFGSLSGGARGPVLALAFTLTALLGILSLRGRLDRGLAVTLVVAASVGAGLVLLTPESFVTTESRFAFLVAERGEVGRWERFHAAWEAMLRVPEGVRGLGIGGFSRLYGWFDDARGEYPHNVFLEIGSELGWVGLTAFVLLVGWGLGGVMKALKSVPGEGQPDVVAALSLLLFALANACVSGDINDNRMLFACIGLAFAVASGSTQTGAGAMPAAKLA